MTSLAAVLTLIALTPSSAPPDIDRGATATSIADRVGNPHQVTPTSPPPPAGLRGMPFAPAGLDRCDELNFYRVQAGLPVQFSDQPRSGRRSLWGYGWRESNCRNTVENACCHGWWQIHEGNFGSRSTYAPFFRSHCEAAGWWDVQGDGGLAKQKQACVAKVMFDMSGLSPWRL